MLRVCRSYLFKGIIETAPARSQLAECRRFAMLALVVGKLRVVSFHIHSFGYVVLDLHFFDPLLGLCHRQLFYLYGLR